MAYRVAGVKVQRDNYIFHIIKADDWKEFQNKEFYFPKSFTEDGFIHCSTANQIEGVANSNFKGITDLQLLVIDKNKVKAEIRYEGVYEGYFYPHIYGHLEVYAVVKVEELKPGHSGVFNIEEILKTHC